MRLKFQKQSSLKLEDRLILHKQGYTTYAVFLLAGGTKTFRMPVLSIFMADTGQ